MKFVNIILIIALSLPSYLEASIMRVEPDDFSYLSPLTHAAQGVTLSLSSSDGQIRPDFTIVSLSEFGIPSTGHSFFGARSNSGYGAQFFLSSANLRADFDSLMKSVSVDFIGCCNGPLTTGMLRVFNSSGILLGSYVTSPLPRNVVETGTITTTDTEIAYVLASTTSESNATYLDNLVVSTIPVPPALYLFGSGLIGLIGLTRKKMNR
jgi:hypothetical protein